MSWKRRVPEDSDFCCPGNCLKKQLKPLSGKSGLAIGHSGEVTPGLCETFHYSKSDRVRHVGEHNGDRQLGFLECDHRRRSDRNDYVRLLHPDLCDKGIQPLGISFAAQQIDGRGAAVQPKLAQSFEELMDRRSVWETAVKYGNPHAMLGTCPGHDQPGQ